MAPSDIAVTKNKYSMRNRMAFVKGQKELDLADTRAGQKL
jgi:hypothetical protein